MSLGQHDNDLRQLCGSLAAALRTTVSPFGTATDVLVALPQLATPAAFAAALLHDLAGVRRPLVLVLDDYHVLAPPPVHELLNLLVAHAPPQLHLVVVGRSEPALPLAQLRASERLVEVRAGDLRFTLAEVDTFLRHTLGVALDSETVQALERRTEGWIASLQLAGLSMRGRDPATSPAFVTTFSGSHQYVFDYLVDEVIGRQDAVLQNLLCQTAFLDRFCVLVRYRGQGEHTASWPYPIEGCIASET